MSWFSSIIAGGPALRVLGLDVDGPGLGELLLLSEVDLSLFSVVDGICYV